MCDFVRSVRNKRDWTAKRLGEEIGCSGAFVLNVENLNGNTEQGSLAMARLLAPILTPKELRVMQRLVLEKVLGKVYGKIH